ncbi:DUF4397 domain-containing protein [Rhodoferax aquaticus]|nr:DUF4397 domain-containing protein [Rhodoferax aquaticus]
MKNLHTVSLILRTALVSFVSVGALLAFAQPAGTLYDPEPPADSAYVRVLHSVKGAAAIDVVVDGKARATKLNFGQVGDYMVLSAGKHTIALHPASKDSALVTFGLDVVRGKSLTLSFPAHKTGTVPIVFEDKSSTNKLKAMLTVYQLDAQTPSVDVMTADGNTKVFSALGYGTSMAIQVNPIAVELVAAKAGDKQAKTKVPLEMAQGGAYSVFLMSDGAGKMTSIHVQNKTEVYTGK